VVCGIGELTASADPAVRAFIADKSEAQLAGQAIATTLAGCPHITPELFAIVQTAEATGDFTPVARLAELYEDGFR